MDIKGLSVGQILVSKINTDAGVYNSFWVVSEKTQRTASVQRLRVNPERISKTETKVTPLMQTSGSASFKMGIDAGGLYLGGSSAKNDLKKTYISEEFDDASEYINIFDASKLK